MQQGEHTLPLFRHRQFSSACAGNYSVIRPKPCTSEFDRNIRGIAKGERISGKKPNSIILAGAVKNCHFAEHNDWKGVRYGWFIRFDLAMFPHELGLVGYCDLCRDLTLADRPSMIVEVLQIRFIVCRGICEHGKEGPRSCTRDHSVEGTAR